MSYRYIEQGYSHMLVSKSPYQVALDVMTQFLCKCFALFQSLSFVCICFLKYFLYVCRCFVCTSISHEARTEVLHATHNIAEPSETLNRNMK